MVWAVIVSGVLGLVLGGSLTAAVAWKLLSKHAYAAGQAFERYIDRKFGDTVSDQVRKAFEIAADRGVQEFLRGMRDADAKDEPVG